MKQRSAFFAVVATLGLAAVGCGGGGGSSPTAASSKGLAEVEYASRQLVNGERDAASVNPTLGNDPELDAIARAHSKAMRDEGFFSHTTPSGLSLAGRMSAQGYSFVYVGENLARVTNAGNPAAYAHELLMQNPHHRGNILDTKFGRIGVGVAYEGSTVWITQIFVKR